MGGERDFQELSVCTEHIKHGKDSISITLPAVNHRLERIVVNGKELDMEGLSSVLITIDAKTVCPVMRLEYVPEFFRR